MHIIKTPMKTWNAVIFIIILIQVSLNLLFMYVDHGWCSTYSIYDTSKVLNNSKGFFCVNRPLEASIEEKGNYLVYYNILRASARFSCDESVTITTMGDYTFLDNIVPLVEIWKGPISVALYSPGYDFVNTLESIDYLRQCTSELVQKLVTFHLFHERNHMPKLPNGIQSYIDRISNMINNIDCRIIPPYQSINKSSTYRSINKLKFGINIARNIARRGAQTHYFLATDLELYPSEGIIPHFLHMIRNNATLQNQGLAFALPVFEIKNNLSLPINKSKLQEMLYRQDAVVFHEQFCTSCHTVPNSRLWKRIKSPISGEISEFVRAKRQGRFYLWEPFFIGTHTDPMHDERLYWEGAGDKMVQAYAMCLLDYEFVVLHNAFLVHKAGIKDKPPQAMAERNNSRQMMQNTIKPELDKLYGYRKLCTMIS